MNNDNRTARSLPEVGNGCASVACDASVTPSVTKPALATESGHWYKQDGSPFYTYRNGSGEERPVTLREARKVNAVPSVTTVLKVAASEGLQRYFDRQMFNATVEFCAEHPEFLESSFDWEDDAQDLDIAFSECLTASKEHSKAAADKGTALHGAIERWLTDRYLDADDPYYEHVLSVIGTLTQYGIPLEGGASEKSFAHEMGFGGKVDYHEKIDGGLVLDFKSKPRIEPGKRYGYDNHAQQLAAYSMGLGMPYARGINVFVGIEDKRVLVHEWSTEDLSRGWSMFSLLLKYWQVAKNYYPRKEEEAA